MSSTALRWATMKTPAVDAFEDENEEKPAEYQIRMRRAPGGRRRVIYVRVTEDEDREIRRRAIMERRSTQRFLIETALSGSARVSVERSRAQRDAEMARIVLTRLANNVNQLAKWANTNHAMPTNLDALIDELGSSNRIRRANGRRARGSLGGRAVGDGEVVAPLFWASGEKSKTPVQAVHDAVMMSPHERRPLRASCEDLKPSAADFPHQPSNSGAHSPRFIKSGRKVSNTSRAAARGS